jgi:serine/threonine protein phosphatase PrpC
MITCPQCGFEAPDDATFCDRCGQGLKTDAAASESTPLRPPPLPSGTVVGLDYEIAELVGHDSLENRYRAVRAAGDKLEKFRLRERFAPAAADLHLDGQAAGAVEPPPAAEAEEEDPAGPHAKTRDLKPPPAGLSKDAPVALGEAAVIVEESAEAQANEARAAKTTELRWPLEGPETAGAENQESQYAEDGASDGEAAQGEIAMETAASAAEDLGELFGRLLALSALLDHPAFERAREGFSTGDRIYLVYPDANLQALSSRPGGAKMDEPRAVSAAIQLCQAVSFLHRRGLRLNDVCPESIATDGDGRIRLTGLDYVSNDNELQAEPIFNSGFTAPEIYRGRKVDKRADIFSVGALLYTALTGERLESESWREEAGPVRFYPPHVISPELEQAVRHALQFDPRQRWPTIDDFKAELLRLNSEVKIRASAMTDVGMVRELNEDSVLTLEYLRDSKVDPRQAYLYAVCDGMGGAEAGETASAIAVGALRDYVEARVGRGETQDLGKLLVEALEEANRQIIDYQRQHPEARGMGSTGVAALIVPPDGAVAWVGDSRAYLLEGGALRQVSKDHSLVQRLVEIGQITPEEARHHEHRNVITRSLGARQSGPAGAESVGFRLRRGARLLLCSDGLTAHVEDKDLTAIIGRHADPYAAARELVVAANAGGGTDNISVVVVFAS